MAHAQGVHPARREVELQLERILADEVVASHAIPAGLLAYIVARTLDGQEVAEADIRADKFPEPDYYRYSNVVRINMQTVRRLLAEYYAGSGKDDPIIIALPESPPGKRIKFKSGDAYRPRFTYNPDNALAREFAIANKLLGGGPSQSATGLTRLEAIVAAEPAQPDAVLGIAEAIGSRLVLEEGYVGAFVLLLLDYIARIEAQVPDYWRVHSVRGLLHLSNQDFSAAKKEFDIALALDRQSTINRGWYVAFLFATGRHEEGLRLFSVYADERVDDAYVQALHGVLLCKANHPQEGERVLWEALTLDRNCWTAHYGLVLHSVLIGNQEKRAQYMRRLEELLEPEEFGRVMRELKGIEERLR
jgi:hypothetical protein